jgi:two-component system, NarL family, sensor histidine kinase UhpB
MLPMTLRLQINLIVGALSLLFMVSVTWLELRSVRDSVLEETAAANRVAAQMLNRTVWRYASQGTPAMLAFLQGMGRVRSNDIALLDPQGQELYRSPPSPYKTGRDAPAWFAGLVSPVPVVQTFDFPNGKLVVRSNASRAVLDAWDSMAALLQGGVALLVAANLLVFWLVGRSVRPFGRIVGALNQLEAGRFDVTLPVLAGTEAAAIGAAFNRMVGQLQDRIESERRALRAELLLSDNRELTRGIEQRIERERRMIARELHDELGQSVIAMRSMALAIAQRVQAVAPESADTARLIADESSRLYDAMHGIIPRLTPLVLDSFGLSDALNDLAEHTRRSQPALGVELHAALGDTTLGSEAALGLYRAAQEGISNAIRHGAAQHLRLGVTAEGANVQLTLEDDGRGLADDWASRQGHYGLRWLTERIQALGGTLRIEPVTPHGVRLKVTVPAGSNVIAPEGVDEAAA